MLFWCGVWLNSVFTFRISASISKLWLVYLAILDIVSCLFIQFHIHDCKVECHILHRLIHLLISGCEVELEPEKLLLLPSVFFSLVTGGSP